MKDKEELNLAKELPKDALSSLSYYLKKVIEEDKESRKNWLDEIEDIKPYLGFSFEEIANKDISQLVSDIVKYNFQTYDSTLATCVMKLWCLIRGQILPRLGPVGVDFNTNNSEEYMNNANFIKDKLNSFLTTEDVGFYPDYDKFLFYLVFYGCITRKIYFDPALKRPVTRFIKPEDFLIDNDSSSIEESNRLTHVLHLSKREIILEQQAGRFIDPKLTYANATKDDFADKSDSRDPDVDLSVYSDKSSFDFYETHVYLDLKSFFKNEIAEGTLALSELPLPYIVTMCADTDRIVSILPNWNEEDDQKKRVNCFIHYSLFPNFNLYSLGLAKLLGGNAIAQTKILRMIIDAGVHQNFPGGFYANGAENLNNNLNIVPGSFIPLDCSGVGSVKDSIAPLPFQGASPVMLEISQMLTAQMQQLSGTTEITADNDMNNAPVGTTLAALEVNHRLQSTVLQTIHQSFSEEIRLIYKHFNFPIDYYDIVQAQDITLVSDPSIESTTQRIIKAETVLKLAESAPQMHNMYNVLKNMYEALGVKDIDSILIDPATIPQEPEEGDINMGMTPAQLQMADIEQRKADTELRAAEIESRERIAQMKLEGDGYKTQSQIDLQSEKIAHENENTRLKRDFELERIHLQEQELEWRKQIETLEMQQRQEKSELLERLAELEEENETLKNGLINA